MCGLAGILNLSSNKNSVSDSLLTKVRDTMVHRGPDGGENWIDEDGRIGLAHRRLSIIDLTTIANQPMSNEDDSIWVVFNGEIYNYIELKQELTLLGNIFRTNTIFFKFPKD